MSVLARQIESHARLAEMARAQAQDHSSETGALWRLVEAVHELGLTTAISAQSARVDESEIEQLGVDVSAIATAAHMVRENVDRVTQGLAPWGAMRESLDALNRAVDKVVMR